MILQHKQHPLGSGFTAASTAEEVLAGIDLTGKHVIVTDYDPSVAYAQSKVANVLFTVELDRRWASHGIRAYAAHPGVVVGTALNSSASEEERRAMGLIDEAGQPIINPHTGRKTPQQGAATIVFAATSPLLDEIGGVYLKDSDISPLVVEELPMTTDPEVEIPAEVAPHSIDPQSAQRLWEFSERLLRGRSPRVRRPSRSVARRTMS